MVAMLITQVPIEHVLLLEMIEESGSILMNFPMDEWFACMPFNEVWSWSRIWATKLVLKSGHVPEVC